MLLNTCYSNEQVFLKTTNQHAFIEMVLLQLLTLGSSSDNSNDGEFGSGFSPGAVLSIATDSICDADDEGEQDDQQDDLLQFCFF